ncbi:MAG TPA: hypothetical protein VG028_13385 [Terriglobia bacterium]|nr:hypothetical protein [Terriglobia bacterium]
MTTQALARRMPFAALQIGARFRFPREVATFLPMHKGFWFKTSAQFYGQRPGQALYPWLNEALEVEAIEL